jgi:hypothetical protein
MGKRSADSNTFAFFFRTALPRQVANASQGHPPFRLGERPNEVESRDKFRHGPERKPSFPRRFERKFPSIRHLEISPGMIPLPRVLYMPLSMAIRISRLS